MCILIIELIWVAKYGKMGEKPPFLEIFEGWYRYQTEWYRYHKCSVHWYRYPMFYFEPVLVFWSYLAHFLSNLSDSSG